MVDGSMCCMFLVPHTENPSFAHKTCISTAAAPNKCVRGSRFSCDSNVEISTRNSRRHTHTHTVIHNGRKSFASQWVSFSVSSGDVYAIRIRCVVSCSLNKKKGARKMFAIKKEEYGCICQTIEKWAFILYKPRMQTPHISVTSCAE